MIRKKRGLGAGKINGVGGRLEKGETPEAGIVREAQEELGITLWDANRRGELHFQFLDGYSLFCTVFVASRFAGTPIETPEAVPLWFDLHQLPFDEMWEDDKLWLREALDGKTFRGFFVFDGDKMLIQRLEWGRLKRNPEFSNHRSYGFHRLKKGMELRGQNTGPQLADESNGGQPNS
jgi:8-oxo-dGTP diphosphatase